MTKASWICQRKGCRQTQDLTNCIKIDIQFLVGGFNHLEKYESQWEGLSHIPYIMENSKCSKPPTRFVDTIHMTMTGSRCSLATCNILLILLDTLVSSCNIRKIRLQYWPPCSGPMQPCAGRARGRSCRESHALHCGFAHFHDLKRYLSACLRT